MVLHLLSMFVLSFSQLSHMVVLKKGDPQVTIGSQKGLDTPLSDTPKMGGLPRSFSILSPRKKMNLEIAKTIFT